MLDTGFSPWPSYTAEEAEAAARVLLSNRVNYWTGQECRLFETEFAQALQVEHAVAVANGTLALEVALRALDIRQGDEVIVTPRTFLASASAIVSVGAVPVFADVDLDSQNITAESIVPLVTPRTRAIMCVHLAGWPCEMDAISSLASEHNLSVIEDCAQAHGAKYRGRSVGGLGDIAAWSFCQDKVMTTGGEGGMVTMHRPDLWRRVWAYKDHGKSYEAVYERTHPPGFRWLHESFGSNFRMIEIQAVLGRIQLRRLEGWRARRRQNAHALLDAFEGCSGLRTPRPPVHVEHAWYRAYAFVRTEALASGWSRDRVMDAVRERGVPCFTGSCSEVYLERAFEGERYRPANRMRNAQTLGDTSLAFLVHPTLDDAEIAKTIEAVQAVMRAATR